MNESTGSLRPRAMAKYLRKGGVNVFPLVYSAQKEDIIFDGSIINVRDLTRETTTGLIYCTWRIWQRGLRFLGFYRSNFEFWRNKVLQQADAIIAYSEADVILATYPTIEALELGLALSRKYKIPLISDFRDGLLFEPIESIALENQSIRQSYKLLEKEIIKRSCLTLTISDSISEYFRITYGDFNIKTLPNGFDHEEMRPNFDVELPTGFVNIVHTGRLSISRSGVRIDVLVEAINLLVKRMPNVKEKLVFHFLGELSYDEREKFKKLSAMGLVKIWGNMSRNDALGFQRKADLLLLITESDKVSVATGKLFEYLAANKPILALTRGTEAERIVRETGVGHAIDPNDKNQIVNFLEDFLNGGGIKIERNEIAINKFSRESQMKNLLEWIHQINCDYTNLTYK